MLCAICATPSPTAAHFCSACGAALLTSAAAQRQGSGGERRHLTALFSDLAGSTQIAARLGPEQWHELAAQYQRLGTEAINGLGGHVGKYLGDGIVAYFGYPDALEDAAERAIRAALAIVDAVEAINAHYAPLYDVTLAVRVGLHAGSVVVAPGGGAEADMFGDVPNIASRVQTAATANSVMITEAVHKIAEGAFLAEDAGKRRLKGVAQPMRLFKVLGPAPARPRSHGWMRKRSTFVGREEEMRGLLSRYRRALEGEGQVILICGEPGIGKSRLVEEFGRAIKSEPHLWVEAGGQPIFKNTPFHVAVQMLTHGLAWRGEEPKETRVEQLKRALANADIEVNEALPVLAELLGLQLPEDCAPSPFSADEKRALLLSVLKRWVLNAARDQVVVIAIEDLHWVDPSTLELTETLVEDSAASRVFILTTMRPEMGAPWPVRPHHTQLTLGRLDNAQVRDIVRAVEGPGWAAGLTDSVVEQADGVPLFAEELARLMLDSGGDADAHQIPATLADSLTARLDRLGNAKYTAQLAALLGREFQYELLRSLSSGSDDELRADLASLADADLVYSDGATLNPIYRFKHSLLRDAAYDGLLHRQRRALHARVAQTITNEFATLARTHPEVLAHHWSEAGDSDMAIDAWISAGKSGAARHAYKESAEAFQNALSMLATLPDSPHRDSRELQLWRSFVGSARIAYGYSAAETRRANRMARRLAEKTGDVRKRFAQVAGEWMAASSAGYYRTARKLAGQLAKLAEEQATPDGFATAHMITMTSRFRSGDLRGAEQAFAAGAPYFNTPEFVRRPGASAQAFGNAAMNAWVMGNIAETRRRIHPVHELAGSSDNPYELAFSNYMAAMVALMLEDIEGAETLARRSLEIAAEGRFPQFAATASIILGCARARRGDVDDGLGLMLKGLAGMERNRSRAALTMYLTWLSETCGEPDQAIERAEQALTINPQEKFFRPESLRVRGELRLVRGDRDAAEADLRRAYVSAEIMGAELLRQRAAASLSRLELV